MVAEWCTVGLLRCGLFHICALGLAELAVFFSAAVLGGVLHGPSDGFRRHQDDITNLSSLLTITWTSLHFYLPRSVMTLCSFRNILLASFFFCGAAGCRGGGVGEDVDSFGIGRGFFAVHIVPVPPLIRLGLGIAFG